MDIYPLARCLHALIRAPLQYWTGGEPNHPDEGDRLANLCLDISHDAFEGTEDDHENAEMIGQTTGRTPTAGCSQACARAGAPAPLR
jgi:hypothetical protein